MLSEIVRRLYAGKSALARRRAVRTRRSDVVDALEVAMRPGDGQRSETSVAHTLMCSRFRSIRTETFSVQIWLSGFTKIVKNEGFGI